MPSVGLLFFSDVPSWYSYQVTIEFYAPCSESFVVELYSDPGESYRGLLVQARIVADGSPVGVFSVPSGAEYKLSACPLANVRSNSFYNNHAP